MMDIFGISPNGTPPERLTGDYVNPHPDPVTKLVPYVFRPSCVKCDWSHCKISYCDPNVKKECAMSFEEHLDVQCKRCKYKFPMRVQQKDYDIKLADAERLALESQETLYGVDQESELEISEHTRFLTDEQSLENALKVYEKIKGLADNLSPIVAVPPVWKEAVTKEGEK